MRVTEVDWYDYPQYYDLLFQEDTKREASFLEAAFQRYGTIPVQRIVEPGCGSGRLIVELAARGFHVTGLDLNETSLQYARNRLKRRGLAGRLVTADMASFTLRRPVEGAYCLVNTFRHLLDEATARKHLQSVARALRPGGIYVLGLHLFPPDAIDECTERWTAKRGRTRVTGTLRVLDTDHRRRLERIRVTVRVSPPSGLDLRMRSEFQLRRYSAAQIKKLFASVPELELCDVFDFWFDLEDPLPLDNELADSVFILRRRTTDTTDKNR